MLHTYQIGMPRGLKVVCLGQQSSILCCSCGDARSPRATDSSSRPSRAATHAPGSLGNGRHAGFEPEVWGLGAKGFTEGLIYFAAGYCPHPKNFDLTSALWGMASVMTSALEGSAKSHCLFSPLDCHGLTILGYVRPPRSAHRDGIRRFKAFSSAHPVCRNGLQEPHHIEACFDVSQTFDPPSVPHHSLKVRRHPGAAPHETPSSLSTIRSPIIKRHGFGGPTTCELVSSFGTNDSQTTKSVRT